MEVSLLSGVVVKIADLEFEAARAIVGKALRVHPQAVKILHQNEVISELPADPDANLLGVVDQCRHAMEVKWRDLQGGAQELMRRAKACQDIRKKLKAENLLHSRGDLDHAIRRQEGAVLMGVSTLAQEKKEVEKLTKLLRSRPLVEKCHEMKDATRKLERELEDKHKEKKKELEQQLADMGADSSDLMKLFDRRLKDVVDAFRDTMLRTDYDDYFFYDYRHYASALNLGYGYGWPPPPQPEKDLVVEDHCPRLGRRMEGRRMKGRK